MAFTRGTTANFFGNTGQAGTTAEALDGVSGVPASNGIVITNIDSTENLLIGTAKIPPTTTTGYTLVPGASVEIHVTDPENLMVIASANTTDYTWFQE